MFGGAILRTFSFTEAAKSSMHKRSTSDLIQKNSENYKPNSIFEGSHPPKLEKMAEEDYVKTKKAHSSNIEAQESHSDEILALQGRLRNQIAMRKTLEKAMNNNDFSNDTKTDKSIPKVAKELIKDIAVLELEVAHLEKYLLSLYRKTYDQKMSSRSNIDERSKMISSMQNRVFQEASAGQDNMISKHSSISQSSHIAGQPQNDRGDQPKQFNGNWGPENMLDSTIHQCHSSTSQRSVGPFLPMNSMASAVDTGHSLPLSMLEKAQTNHSTVSLADHLGNSIHDYTVETPNSLSEEMIRCISSIYFELADPPLVDNPDFPPSPASISSSPIEFPAYARTDMWSPQHVSFSSYCSSPDNPFRNGHSKEFGGPYCRMTKVERLCSDNQKLKDIQTKLQDFRLLVTQLEDVDPRKLRREEKLAFWINVHNALIMHAYLAYGIPRNNVKRMSLVLKAAYIVGGRNVNIEMIQNLILGCRLPRPGQWLHKLFPIKTKFRVGDPRKAYSMDYSEPRLHFALSAGSSSDPAVRVYTPNSVFEDLEGAKEEYIQSTLFLHKDKKLHLPKLVESFAKDSDLCSAGLVDMIEHLLPNSWRKSIQQCQHRKSSKSLEWTPHNFSFRYLFSKDLAW
ncbi:uncharacterized protein LOC126683493 [Mercurialis annua]|uniref:uncharacterized protein LOC126683493 n=1 Tax=Mercurialis annua TaxID=3986 RepID=UPI00215F498B|nr:uncharacterized protein LOC126683493 [Mercurialis annua]